MNPNITRYLMNCPMPNRPVLYENTVCTTCKLNIVYCFQDEKDRPGPLLEFCAFCQERNRS